MIPGVNPVLIEHLLKGKADDLLAGTPPDGFKIKEQSRDRIVLVPSEPFKLGEGIALNSLGVSITYKGVEINILHE